MKILAFNIAHDSSVCLISDGNIEFFCKEERLSRIKRDKHPFKSLDLLGSLDIGQIDHALYITPSNNEPDIETVYKSYIKKKFNVELENFSNLQHHLCHASLAFYNSKFDNCLVFVIDRNGSMFFVDGKAVAREAETVFSFSKNKSIAVHYKSFWIQDGYENKKHEVRNLISNEYPGCDISVNNSLSIVKVYEAATTLIDQPALENGKTMGLSSYGTEKTFDPLFYNGVAIGDKFTHINNEDNTTCFYGFEDRINKDITPDNYQFYADNAKHVQIETQQAALRLIQDYVKKTGIKNVCIVGGYGLNVVANNYYLKNLPEVNFYFEPVADDTGVPIGAAMLKYNLLSGIAPTPAKNNFYHYYDHAELAIEGKAATIDELCTLLINQKSLAIFEGNPEAGPRALGHRSILFDPRNKNCKAIVNQIKNREWYRPFAGIILKSEFKKYFDTLGLVESPYMTINFDCFEGTEKYVPGIIHVDNTCRIQTIESGFLFDLLTKFYEKTGCPMLLNTSFNLAGQALVQTKQDAIKTLNNSSLDAVYFVDDNKLCYTN